MKGKLITLLLALTVSLGVQSQKKLPNITLKNLNGKEVLSSDLSNDGKPMVISFWATWCKPCLSELSAFNDEYEDWVEETEVKIIAISIDDARTNARVKSMVLGNDWPFEVYLNPNQDFKRALSIVNVPHTLVLNGKGEVVWEHSTYNPGSEEEVITQVRHLVNNQ